MDEKEIDTVMNGYVQNSEMAGGALLVRNKDKILYQKQWGAVQPNSIYRLMSMTKCITAVAVMICVERGLMELDAPLSRYIPAFEAMQVMDDARYAFRPEKLKKLPMIASILTFSMDRVKRTDAVRQITIRDLLSHSSGLQQGMAGLLPKHLMGAYVLSFAFDLVPEELRETYRQRLVELIHTNGDRLDTGFLATPYLLDVLCDLGEKKLADTLLWQNQRPSWLYEVEHGATTIWEGWDADNARKDGRFISFNHYAFGCVDDYLCRRVAGIDSDTPGFTHLVICPDAAGRLTHCKRVFCSEAGPVSVDWDKEHLVVQLPANTTASITWQGKTMEVGSGIYDSHLDA